MSVSEQLARMQGGSGETAHSAQPPDVATPEDLRWIVIVYRLPQAHREAVRALADTLDALREAVKGCGKERHMGRCGEPEFIPIERPYLCLDCDEKFFAAIATLTAGDQ